MPDAIKGKEVIERKNLKKIKFSIIEDVYISNIFKETSKEKAHSSI